ncbi:MAG: adenylosuccinate lyase [Campylobacter sp.]|nr:adenylosuccinate lyase [Campylobacter sp.]
MHITNTLESLSIKTSNDALFCELRNIINKNFTKTIASKGKIILFYEENEMPQRKYLLKFIKNLYKKEVGSELDIKFAIYKTIKLNYVQENALSSVVFVDVNFSDDEIKFKIPSTHKLFASYISRCLKGSKCRYENGILHAKINDAKDFERLELLFSKKEHMRLVVNFNVDNAKFTSFKSRFMIKNTPKFATRYCALASLLEDNFTILNCSKDSSFEEVRESYLMLVKCYHPDRHAQKSEKVRAHYREFFEKIQNAYEGLKPFFKAQENFASA